MRLLRYTVVLLTFFSFSGRAQTLQEYYQILQSQIGEVTIDQDIYRQSFEVLDPQKSKVRYTSLAVDAKGKSAKTTYEFYLSDLDKNTIIRKTSGKQLLVSCSVNNNQKFIKVFKEDQLDSYTASLDILVLNADVGQQVMDAVKGAIPLVAKTKNNFDKPSDALGYLAAHLGQVTTGSDVYVQKFEFNQGKEYLVKLQVRTTDKKGTTANETFEFNVADINKHNLQVKISGSELRLELETVGKEKYIRYTKDGVMENYRSDLSLRAEDIDQARNFTDALDAAISQSKAQMPVFANLTESANFLQNHITEVRAGGTTFKQNLSMETGGGTRAVYQNTETDEKGKSAVTELLFYMRDLEPNSLTFKVSGKEITLLCGVKNKTKFVRYTKDNELQNFTDEVSFKAPDIESARELMEAWKYCMSNANENPPAWKSMAEAMAYLREHIKGATVLKDQYALSFEGSAAEPFHSTYIQNVTDEKGALKAHRYEFYPYMIESNTVVADPSGKVIVVKGTITNKRSFVKEFENDVHTGYEHTLELVTFDAREAQNIAAALKYIAENGKPKPRDWSSKTASVTFIQENIGTIKGDKQETVQRVDLMENDPCKLHVVVTTSDDKGKSTEDIYEFSMKDMNKMMVDYTVKGKDVIITLVCKNKEKFVKAYRNGEQQSYRSDLDLLVADVELARHISEALVSVIAQCE